MAQICHANLMECLCIQRDTVFAEELADLFREKNSGEEKSKERQEKKHENQSKADITQRKTDCVSEDQSEEDHGEERTKAEGTQSKTECANEELIEAERDEITEKEKEEMTTQNLLNELSELEKTQPQTEAPSARKTLDTRMTRSVYRSLQDAAAQD